MRKPVIGFIGQGWIGKNYADDFEERGYEVIRYGLEEPYVANRDQIKNCDIVFIAVPTPTTPEAGFDASIVESVLPLVGEGKVAVIKSTVLPGTTERLQLTFPNVAIMHSPEFLVQKNAAHDARNPERNIVGVTDMSREHAQRVLDTLPKAPYAQIMGAKEAEMVKYVGNCLLALKVLFSNIVYDTCQASGIDYEHVKDAVARDARIGSSHMDVVHDGGRGFGGGCFPKDFAAFIEYHEKMCGTTESGVVAQAMLKKAEEYNRRLLVATSKSPDIIKSVYHDRMP